MRLATARDELEPLRDPTVSGPDDPRLTILVLARVVETLGELELVTAHEIEGLFAVDLAFLQDFYGVINFGNQEEYEDLLGPAQARRWSVVSRPPRRSSRWTRRCPSRPPVQRTVRRCARCGPPSRRSLDGRCRRG